MVNELNFDDITRAEVPVTLGGKKCVLREPTGDAECQYRSALMRGTRFSQDGKQAVAEGNADAELLFISLCLFEKYDAQGQERERPVLLQQVKALPARVTKRLFEQLEAMRPKDQPTDRPTNGQPAAEDLAKNSPDGSTAG